MFFYIVHNSPFWNKMPNKQRNIRTFITGSVLYIGLHIFLYSKFAEGKKELTYFRNYMYYILLIDVIAMAVIYKLYYGKNILGNDEIIKPNETLPFDKIPAQFRNIALEKYMKENPLPIQSMQQMQPMQQMQQMPLVPHAADLHNQYNQPSAQLHQQMVLNNKPPLHQLIEVDDTESVEIPIYASKLKNNFDDDQSIVTVNIPVYKNDDIPLYKTTKKSEFEEPNE